MRIRITDTGADDDLRAWVAFSSVWGEGRGRWRSPEPALPGDHDVELEFPEPVLRFHVSAAETPPSLGHDGNVVTVTAEVLTSPSAPDDLVVTVLLGGDAVLLELDPAAAAEWPAPGSRVSFTAAVLDLCPYDL